VELPQSERFRHILDAHPLAVSEVRDRARDTLCLHDSSRRHDGGASGVHEEGARVAVELAGTIERLRRDPGVQVLSSLPLSLPRTADDLGRLRRRQRTVLRACAEETLGAGRMDRHLEIDTVQKWARDARGVERAHPIAAATL